MSWQEFRLIDWIRQTAPQPRQAGEVGIGDDAAIRRLPNRDWELVTCDALVEDVHWSFRWCDPESLGYKAAAVNLSDIAAMGGIPQRAFLTLALPRRVPQKIIEKILKAMFRVFSDHQVVLAGGDTVLSPGPMMISITLQGTAKSKACVRRSGAQPGDVLLVTGSLGAAAAGLAAVERYRKIPGSLRPVVRRLLRPAPRVLAGQVLARSGHVHAMLDLSDGVAGDVRRLAAESRVGVRIETNRLPIAASTRQAARILKLDPQALALSGGEDYELLFAVPAQQVPAIKELLHSRARIACHRIGEVVPPAAGLFQLSADGRTLALPRAWEHGARLPHT